MISITLDTAFFRKTSQAYENVDVIDGDNGNSVKLLDKEKESTVQSHQDIYDLHILMVIVARISGQQMGVQIIHQDMFGDIVKEIGIMQWLYQIRGEAYEKT